MFAISMLIANNILNRTFDNSFINYVKKDMDEIYKMSSRSFEDYLIINKLENKDITEEKLDYKLLGFISDRINCNGSIYNSNGEKKLDYIWDKQIIEFSDSRPKSFFTAVDNKAVIDLEWKDNKVYGKLSYPIYLEKNNMLDILVCSKNYSDIYNSNLNIKHIINYVIVSIFIILFLLIYLILVRLLKPIVGLSESVDLVAKGEYPEIIKENSSDEIGVLIKSFNIMTNKLMVKEKQQKEFFQNVTHELKTPITNISGYAQLLDLDENKFNDFEKKSIIRIIDESTKMKELVDTLLDISKQESYLKDYNFEVVNLTKVIVETLVNYSLLIEEKDLIVNLGKCSEANINGNTKYIKVLINNLISNAVKYSNENTNIKINIKNNNNTIEISIETIGKNIPKDMEREIFEPFVRVQEPGFKNKDSHGLGLYICKTIVEAHNGEIFLEVDREISNFIVRFPKSI